MSRHLTLRGNVPDPQSPVDTQETTSAASAGGAAGADARSLHNWQTADEPGSTEYLAKAGWSIIAVSLLFPLFALVAAYFAVRVVERGQLSRGIWMLVVASLVAGLSIVLWGLALGDLGPEDSGIDPRGL